MSFTYIDVSDMFIYLEHHRNVSGIQRVQSNLVRSVCLADRNLIDMHFISINPRSGWYQLLDKAALTHLMFAISNAEVAHDRIKFLINDIFSNDISPQFRPGDVYIVAGAFWILGDLHRIYNKLKCLGVIMGCYIYDIIPINQPDFCAEELTASFKSTFDQSTYFFDFMMTISDHTKEEVDTYIRSARLPETMTATVKLAHTINDHLPVISSFDLGGMVFSDFILCVGTIEVRKNHQLLYQVWKLLAEARVSPMPKLVIVGRWGWRVDDLKAQLNATRYLGGSIVVLSDVDDETLELLYRECRFTIFPSFVEGWGMPVGESLVHGRFCLASRSSSIPEVGGEFVEYIDPYNARETFEIVRRYLESPMLLDKKTAIIKSKFIARTWDDFRDEFIATALRCSRYIGSGRKPPVYPALHLGDLIDATNKRVSTLNTEAIINPEFVFVEGWDIAEDLGRWMRSRNSKIVFRSEIAAPLFFVELRLFSVSWASGNTVTISCYTKEMSQVVPAGVNFTVTFELRPQDLVCGLVEIDFSVQGDYRYTDDPRDLCVGIQSVSIRPDIKFDPTSAVDDATRGSS